MKPSPNVGYPLDSVPIIVAEHIDGPYLRCRDGQIHWLTLWERLLLALGLTNAAMLEVKHWRRERE